MWTAFGCAMRYTHLIPLPDQVGGKEAAYEAPHHLILHHRVRLLLFEPVEVLGVPRQPALADSHMLRVSCHLVRFEWPLPVLNSPDNKSKTCD